jgi:transcriptional regulator of acetoin/glycerol metabolism
LVTVVGPKLSSRDGDVEERERTTQQLETESTTAEIKSDGRLYVVYSPDRGFPREPIALERDELLAVGRQIAAPGLTLHDTRLSRLHFRVAWDGRCKLYRVGDAGSRNGLFVNTRPQLTSLLSPGDVLRAGDTLFVYDEGDRMGAELTVLSRAARSDLGILLLGETGVGKEVLARRAHEQSGRPGPFVAVNCAALPRDLAAAELFGHTRAAFSGAAQARDGLFAAARHGTLFLDEIGDLPTELQPLILRALEERSVRPVGADYEVSVDVRIIAATHRDLEASTQGGAFRDDLYARLAQVVIRIPPLRARRAELFRLLASFSQRGLELSPDAAEALLTWSWPRNVRELKALVQGFEVVAERPLLDLEYLARENPRLVQAFAERATREAPAPPGSSAPPPASSSPRSSRKSTPHREELRSVLAKSGGNVAEAARSLGTTRAQIYRWMKSLGLGNDARLAKIERH